jgi:hypothetical protein
MAVAALITWLVTAVAGFYMLGTWISKGGHKAGSGTRLSPGLIFTHFVLAAVGLVVWIVYVINSNETLAWVGFVLLLPVALLGFTMFARWLPARKTTTAESSFPMAVVLGHGLFAATTLVLVLLAALAGAD